MAGVPFSRQARCPGSGRPADKWGRRAQCPECHRYIKVRADGTLWTHVAVYTINYPVVVDREPQPSDGPEYHADHQAWERRQ